MVWLCKKSQLPQEFNNACAIYFTLNLKTIGEVLILKYDIGCHVQIHYFGYFKIESKVYSFGCPGSSWNSKLAILE